MAHAHHRKVLALGQVLELIDLKNGRVRLCEMTAHPRLVAGLVLLFQTAGRWTMALRFLQLTQATAKPPASEGRVDFAFRRKALLVVDMLAGVAAVDWVDRRRNRTAIAGSPRMALPTSRFS
jgi:hypothetical protein